MSMKKRKWLKMMATGCVLGSLLITAACSGKKTSTEDDKTIKVGVPCFYNRTARIVWKTNSERI
ncbi:hypothetical protein ACT7C6_04345 [Bacillus paranthracis]